MEGVAIADRNTLTEIAMAHARVQEVDIRPLVGGRLDLRDGLPRFRATGQQLKVHEALVHGSVD